MKRLLLVLAAGAALFAGTAVASAGVNPWSDDSLCKTSDRYNGILNYQWESDLCNQFEVEQAALVYDFVDFSYRRALSDMAGVSFFPCANEPVGGGSISHDGSNFYNNSSGYGGKSGHARSAWFDHNGMICEVGSDERNAANPQVRLPELTGKSLEALWNEYIGSKSPVDRLRFYIAEGCNPAAEECEVFTESILDFDQDFINKRFPLNKEDVETVLLCTEGFVTEPC